MTLADQSAAVWQSFWSTLSGTPGEIFWDADPREAAEDFALIAGRLDPSLPLVDIGCGNGRHTRFLAHYFGRVIGTDLSEAAVACARATNVPQSILYRALDVRDPRDTENFNTTIGDANVHIRGVLHRMPLADREAAVRGIERLLGAAGTLYLKELSPATGAYFGRLIEEHGTPPGLARAFQSGSGPGTMSRIDLERLFPPDRFVVLATGDSLIQTINQLPDGVSIRVPAVYALIRRQPSEGELRLSADKQPARPAQPLAT